MTEAVTFEEWRDICNAKARYCRYLDGKDRVIFDGETALTGYGAYHERWVKQGVEWKIASLRLSRYIVEMEPPG